MNNIITSEWRDFGNGTTVSGHIFAVSDLHGRLDLATPLIDHLAAIAPLEKTLLVSCGDLVDRGPDSFGTVDLMMSQDDRFGEVVLLCGNHEIMILDAIWEKGMPAGMRICEDYLHDWMRWGGRSVFTEASPDLTMDGQAFARIIEARMGPYLERISQRPAPHHLAGDLMFIHAGVLPDKWFEECLKLKPQSNAPHHQHWAWMVNPFHEWTGGWQEPGRVIVHGHRVCTPEGPLAPGALVDCMDATIPYKRICLDVGAHKFDRLAALEAHGNRYRFHFSLGEDA